MCQGEGAGGVHPEDTVCLGDGDYTGEGEVAGGQEASLVGCSRAQAGSLLAGSCTPIQPRRAPRQAHIEVLDALTWAEDTGARMSREARAEA